MIRLHLPHLRFIRLLLLTCLLACATIAHAQEADDRTGMIKAAIIFKIAKFIEWPESAGPFVICMEENDPLQGVLNSIVEGKEIKGRKIQMQTVDLKKMKVSDLACQILILNSAILEYLKSHRIDLSKPGLLTICNVKDLTWGVCSAQIFEDKNRARIAIDTSLTEKAQLHVSSELLELAVVRAP